MSHNSITLLAVVINDACLKNGCLNLYLFYAQQIELPMLDQQKLNPFANEL